MRFKNNKYRKLLASLTLSRTLKMESVIFIVNHEIPAPLPYRSEILTPIEVSLYLRIHVRTISRLAQKGLIAALRVGRRWGFKKTTLEDWLLRGSVQRPECNKSYEPL